MAGTCLRRGEVWVTWIVWILLFSGAAFAGTSTFHFEAGGKKVEGLVWLPAGPPRALILYFHRGIEDRSAVNVWGELLGARGYAVAGYTATGSTQFAGEARSAVAQLRKQKALADIPVAAVGASLGARCAVHWFAADPGVKALALIVPGDAEGTCRLLAGAAGRPVLMIQAENDEIVGPTAAEALRKCRPPGSVLEVLPGKTHRFPPSDISGLILQWLDKVVPHPARRANG